MSPASHQTARLTRGKHSDPEHGTCVMELASMLAGEAFGDHPRSVCPVVASFLRSYNDGVGDDLRDDLYRYAAEAVGTGGRADVTVARARLCHDWIFVHRPALLGRPRLLRSGLSDWPVLTARPEDPAIGTLAGRLAARLTRRRRPGAHASALALVDRMLDPALAAREPDLVSRADVPARAGW